MNHDPINNSINRHYFGVDGATAVLNIISHLRFSLATSSETTLNFQPDNHYFSSAAYYSGSLWMSYS